MQSPYWEFAMSVGCAACFSYLVIDEEEFQEVRQVIFDVFVEFFAQVVVHYLGFQALEDGVDFSLHVICGEIELDDIEMAYISLHPWCFLLFV